MSVVIRMQRAGGRNRPFFRVVVADSRAMRDGRFLEKVGYYNPITQPAEVEIDEERVQYWIDRGAKPSDSVATLIKRKRKGWVEPDSQAKKPAPAPKEEAPKEAPAAEEPKTEAPAAEEPKTEAPAAEEPKTEAPEAPAAEAESPSSDEK